MVTRSCSDPIAKQLAYAGLPSHGVSCLPACLSMPVATRLALTDALLGASVTTVPHSPVCLAPRCATLWGSGATVVVLWQATLKTGHSSIHHVQPDLAD